MQSLEQLEGTWPEAESPTGLILRCHAARKKPIDQLSFLELATLLNQDIGVKHILHEAVRRLAQTRPDDTEYYDGQLQEAVARKTQQTSFNEPGDDALVDNRESVVTGR
jgi:hypothetical protein